MSEFDPFDVDQPPKRGRRRGPTDPDKLDWVSDSKKKRARRRLREGTVRRLGTHQWVVAGIGKLGDHYPGTCVR